MRTLRARTAATALAAGLAVAALAGCGLDDAPASSLDRVPMTHRALAGAVIDHVGDDASAAAPLFPRDRVPSGSIGVEVALPVEGHDATHVRAVVSPDVKTFARNACDLKRNRYLSGCEESSPGGVDTVLAWSAGYPEEDPGTISAVARHRGWLVTVYASGPFVNKDLGDLRGLADDLAALAADPDVGYQTTLAYAEDGDHISDDVWLDWYGQGNGYPAPKGYDPSDG